MNGRSLPAAVMFVEDRRAAGLKRFWSTFDVLAGSGGFLMFEGGRDAIVDVLFA